MPRISVRSNRHFWVVPLFGLCALVSARADVVSLYATQNPSADSTFTLDFGVYGGPRQANITTTNYALETDALSGTSWFSSYHQTVAPIELPGGVSTGNITVTIQQSQPGPYNPANGAFATQDIYLISFEGDLSMFGLSSPVALPGSANGTIAYESATSGTIVSAWNGIGQLQNPNDPQNPIQFSYQCATSTTFTLVPEPGMSALLALGAIAASRRRR